MIIITVCTPLCLPAVDVILDLFCLSRSILQFKVLVDPSNEVIVEAPFDELMEKIGGEETVDVCAREIVCERLKYKQVGDVP